MSGTDGSCTGAAERVAENWMENMETIAERVKEGLY